MSLIHAADAIRDFLEATNVPERQGAKVIIVMPDERSRQYLIRAVRASIEPVLARYCYVERQLSYDEFEMSGITFAVRAPKQAVDI